MKLEYDLRKLYMDAFAPQPGEKVTFINDLPRQNPSAEDINRGGMTVEWHRVMVELGNAIGFEVAPIVTLDLRNPAPGAFDADGYVRGEKIDLLALMDAWGEKDIVIAITGPSITGELMRRQNQNFRFGSAPNVTSDFEGFKADYSKIPLRFEILVGKMARAVAVEMTFRYFEDTFKCTLDLRGQRYMFQENGDARRPGSFINLPSGCANVGPYPGIEGDIRGPSRSEGQIPALIDEELVVYHIKGNRIVDITGEGEAAERERAHVLDPAHPELAVVTKLGLGVNDEARCNGTHVGDEKTMGMHWGYGPKKHFPDTIWAEHLIAMDMDFVYYDGSRDPIFRNSMYTTNLGELF
ncbi:hypothetical protein JW905_19295 [bacterium]|nr:hypothetical protein [candidate division CSSED10-310 bacterium]